MKARNNLMLIFIELLLLSFISCKNDKKDENTEDEVSKIQYLPNVRVCNSDNNYDVAEFCYYDFDRDEYVPLLDVKYFVRHDTLFTDQIYRSISIFYQDSEGKITKSSSIARDFENNPNVNGWYYLVLNKDKLNEFPTGSEPCKIELCMYDGPISTDGLSTTYAVLWNNSMKCRPNYIYDSIPGEVAKILKMINTGKSQNI